MAKRSCKGTTKAGKPCRAAPLKDDDYCRAHGTAGAPKKEWQESFLAALLQTGMVSEACRVAGVGRSTAYRERQRDEDFALLWADVEERSTEELEAEAVRRAKDGSDTLLIFLLKSRRPSVYRETYRHEHTGPEGAPMQIESDAEGVKLAHELLRHVGAEP